MKLLTAILGALFISLTANAGEGFLDYFNMQILKGAWNETYVMSDKTVAAPAISATVLVFKKKIGDDLYLGFLTSGHSLERITQRVSRDLSQIVISRDIYFFDHLERAGEVNGKIVSSAVDMDRELGFFILQVPGGDPNGFEVLPFSPSCATPDASKVILIGFPGVYLRTYLDQSRRIQDTGAVRKRISIGLYVGEMRFGEDQSSRLFPIFGTTADAIDGNSGGPAVNSLGQLLGILVGSKADQESDYAYKGSEQPGALQAHSFITGCQMTKQFAFDKWGSFLQDLRKK